MFSKVSRRLGKRALDLFWQGSIYAMSGRWECICDFSARGDIFGGDGGEVKTNLTALEPLHLA